MDKIILAISIVVAAAFAITSHFNSPDEDNAKKKTKPNDTATTIVEIPEEKPPTKEIAPKQSLKDSDNSLSKSGEPKPRPPITPQKKPKEITKTLKKTPFPVATLRIYHQDKDSLLGSHELEKAVRFAIDNKRYEDLNTMLSKAIRSEISHKEITSRYIKESINNPLWCNMVNLHKTIDVTLIQNNGSMASGSRNKEFYYWLFTHPEAMTSFLNNLKPEDKLRNVMQVWYRIWESMQSEEQLVKYTNLAIAVAIVFDQPQKTKVPGYSQNRHIDPLSRFALYKQNAEAKRLKTDISKMPTSDLIWVVDIALPDEEIEWAVAKAHFSRRSWGKAYAHIDYLMERAVNDANPYSSYTLAQIQKHGGICGDQTYFSVNTAKANGVPATGVSGSGERGPHAWIAYKPNRDKWVTAGRYENYSNGSTHNSQTNRPFPEFGLFLLSDRKMKLDKAQDAHLLLQLLPILEDSEIANDQLKVVIQSAIKIAPIYAPAWFAYIDKLEQQKPKLNKAQWRKVISDMERVFKKHPSMWLKTRELTRQHLLKGLDTEAITKSQQRYRRELARKFPHRNDLIQQIILSQEQQWTKSGEFKSIRSFYKDALSNFGKNTENFKFIVNRYFLIGKKYPEDQATVCSDIERAYNRLINTKSLEYFKASEELKIHILVAKFYKSIGDNTKFNKLINKINQRKERVAKNAL